MFVLTVALLATLSLVTAGSQHHVDSKKQHAENNAKVQSETTESPASPVIDTMPVDCADILFNGRTTSGVYEVYPFSCSCRQPVRVWCDMETDGGGWMVFLTRQNQVSQENFNRSWAEYKEGFGRADGEFWLGNEMLHRITTTRKYSLRADLELTNGVQQFEEWETFRIDQESEKYRMTVQNYLSPSTTYSSCFSYSNSRFFSTYDRDYDSSSDNCAASYGGGWWWYSSCRYNLQLTSIYNQNMNTTCGSRYLQVSKAQLKIRPTICNEPYRRIALNNYECGTCL